ncbi:MAG: acetoacetate--CoA ligase [Flavobacteriales bacterium]|nr:acetoacetate--CoA ligase [Flavobacteriales bacterium]
MTRSRTDRPMESAPVLWNPSTAWKEQTNMAQYLRWIKDHRKLSFESYEDLRKWSVDHIADFWLSIWEYYDVISHSDYEKVIDVPSGTIMGTRWFTGSTLNYAEHVFRQSNDQHPAIIFKSERHPIQHISWKELESRVAAIAAWLKNKGVSKGDRVVSFLPNTPEALMAFLATNSIGAIWSSCSPDFGTASVVDRFQQIEPKVLFTSDGYSYNGKPFDKTAAAQELVSALPTLEHVVWFPYLNTDAPLPSIPNIVLWNDVVKTASGKLTFTPVSFDHPIWVLYSSGTTGKPKAITHSQGGILLEHLKALGLHQDCKPGDRFFWYSTTGWMMWNYANSALLHGSTVVIYEGAAAWPDIHALWNFAAEAGINHFGGGAAYYIACMKKGVSYAGQNKFPALRSVGSTGSPLPPEAFEWLYDHIKQDMWLISLSGGTDICSGFVGGSPLLPVHKGEIQCRMLGCAVEAFNDDGEAIYDEVGEMVITQPMPSMPVFFWNDEGQEKYRASYFEMYPGIWRHGDWLRITDHGSLIIYGRSDATLNRGGVRIGTSEVYSAVDSIPEVADSLVVCLEKDGGSYYMPLFVVMSSGHPLNDAMKDKINATLKSAYSPRHVPDEIIEVSEIPYTISGKKMEAPVKKILMGMDPKKAVSKDAMRNPAALDVFMKLATA